MSPILKDRTDAWKDMPLDSRKEYRIQIPALMLRACKEGTQYKFYVPKKFSKHVKMKAGKTYWVVIHEAD